MALRDIMEADLATIIESDDCGAGHVTSLTDPDGGNIPEIKGISDDISAAFDPETGQLVVGHKVSVVYRLSTIYSAGLKTPKGVASESSKPWIVEFTDVNGLASTKFKVSTAAPDRTLGVVVCMLEGYTE